MAWSQMRSSSLDASFDSISHDKTRIMGLAWYYIEHKTEHSMREVFSSQELSPAINTYVTVTEWEFPPDTALAQADSVQI